MAEKVVVAMSGGVDSSVAALLLCRRGYDVVGVTMKLYSLDEADLPAHYQGCCTLDDVEDARRVCQRLGVPHYVLNVQQEFQTHVIDYFRAEYSRGRTPHPCIACNDKIKFNFLSTRAAALDARYVATGHYARIQAGPDGFVLRKGVDAAKDQSYVLFGMGQSELAHSLMPVGDYSKEEIRRLAQEAELVNADKPDSQDICFIPSGDYKAFLKNHGGQQPGEIVDLDGTVVGQHHGIEFFTVGQRRGLGLAAGSAGQSAKYVIRVEPDTRQVVIGPDSALFRESMWVSRVNYVQGTPVGTPGNLWVNPRGNSNGSFREDTLQSVGSPGSFASRRGWRPGCIPGTPAGFNAGPGRRVLPGGHPGGRRDHRSRNSGCSAVGGRRVKI